MKHGFIKVAAATPNVALACCSANADNILTEARRAADAGANIVVFPELSVCGYTCQDLLFSESLLSSASDSVSHIIESTKDLDIIIIIGFPLVVNDKLYNCCAVSYLGRLLGIVPKEKLCDCEGLWESRYFSALTSEKTENVIFNGSEVPFGSNIVFECKNLPSFKFSVAFGNELYGKAELAPIIASPAARFEKADSRKKCDLSLSAISEVNNCAVVYASCGKGESGTDGIYAGHCVIFENAQMLAENEPFGYDASTLTFTEVDVALLASLRRKNKADFTAHTTVKFDMPLRETTLTRKIAESPFIPDDAAERTEICKKTLEIQARALASRIEKAYAKKCVIGISGGLDSCLALLVCERALDILCRPHSDIVAITMPCFGTTSRTRSNAEIICEEIGAELRCINIAEAVSAHFTDIGHDPERHDVTFENAQARERTQILMDVANMEGGMVIGTGDLSELALGWATYNGDHMSMYGVNGGIPKTFIRAIVDYYASRCENKKLADALFDILDTPVSPELLPADSVGNIAQKTEDLVGPYEIHDFYIFYMLSYGFAPDKLYRLAKYALGAKYSDETLKKWLKNLVRRFFAQQFKRSCLPDGPAPLAVSLSPRGAWLMPSDAVAKDWLDAVEKL